METIEENAANQIPEGGVQEPVIEIPEGGALETVKEESPGDAEKKVSVEAVIAETKKRQEVEAQLAAEQQARQQAEYQAQLLQQQYAQQVQQQAPAPTDDEYPTYGAIRQMQQEQAQSLQSQNLQMQSQAFLIQHPDFSAVVGVGSGGVFKPSEHLTKALQSNPALQGIQQTLAQGNLQAQMVAYNLAKSQQQFDEQQAELTLLKQAAAASQEQVAAQVGVTSPLSVGGGGGVTVQGHIPDPNSQEGDAYYARMKDGELG